MWNRMSNDFLSQEEIDALLKKNQEIDGDDTLTIGERDLLGEVGNISMATAATALSTILGKKVNITTPNVEVTTLTKLQEGLTIPNVVLQVKFEQGLQGTNILLINVSDASIIANLMMGGDGTNPNSELSEIEISAVSEAMNQMIGSASTSMATMLKKDINIYPPETKIWDKHMDFMIEDIDHEESIVKIAFRMTVEGLIDSKIMQIFTMDTVKYIVNELRGGQEKVQQEGNPPQERQQPVYEAQTEPEVYFDEQPKKEPVTVQKPHFGELENKPSREQPRNIDLIMDVPLEFSVVLGKTQRTIKDILSLSPGSVVELNKYAEEPLEIYVNGKLIAQGEVVVINENFGIRITNIISATERVKNLK